MPKLTADQIRDRLDVRAGELRDLGFSEIAADIEFLSEETKRRKSARPKASPRPKDPRLPEAVELAIFKHARDNPGASNKEIAEAINVPESRVSTTLNGKRGA